MLFETIMDYALDLMLPVLDVVNVVVGVNINLTNAYLSKAPVIDCNTEHVEAYSITVVKMHEIDFNSNIVDGRDITTDVVSSVVDCKKPSVIQVETLLID